MFAKTWYHTPQWRRRNTSDTGIGGVAAADLAGRFVKQHCF
jgi:hypothetical protein